MRCGKLIGCCALSFGAGVLLCMVLPAGGMVFVLAGRRGGGRRRHRAGQIKPFSLPACTMPQKEPLPQNGGTTPPAPETAQSGRLLMHVLRLHRKARVGFFENLLLPCAAPAAPADPKAVRQKGEGGLTRRKNAAPQERPAARRFSRTSVRRRMRETQSVRQRTESAVGSPVRGRNAVSSRRHAKKARAVRRRAGKRGRIDGVQRIFNSPAPLSVRRQAFRSPSLPKRKSRPPPERASRRRQSEAPSGFVQNGH